MKTKNDNNQPTIRKIARIRDDATGQYSEIVEFPISDSTTARLELAPAVIHDLRQFADKLLNAGAILPKDVTEQKELLRAVADSDAPKEFVYAAETGWLNDECKVFVKADGVIGNSDTNIIGINPVQDVKDQSGHLSIAGTWETWKTSVAQKARLSSISMFAICVALAAPLLRIIGHQSFSICIFGRTRIGKTFATLIGASVRGIGQKEDLIAWNITDDRLEQRLVEYNDSVFPIDDLMKMRGSKKDKHVRIEDIAYLIEQGHQKGRHSSFAKAHGAARKWRAILFTSNEQSVAELAQGLGLERRHGATVRLIDVPGQIDGLDHIFDRLKESMEIATFHDWMHTQFTEIARDCAQNHGAAFDRYIKGLIFYGRATVAKCARNQIKLFLSNVIEETDGRIARDVAHNYGLIYAGGMLGIQTGILPWTREELLDAVTKCYLAARELLPDEGVALRRGIPALRERLRQLPSLSSLPIGKTAKGHYENVDGYWKRESGMYRCIIKCDAFNSIFSSTYDRNLILNWLIRERRIAYAMSKVAAPASEPRPKKQHEWPDGERRRSYEIYWPRKA